MIKKLFTKSAVTWLTSVLFLADEGAQHLNSDSFSPGSSNRDKEIDLAPEEIRDEYSDCLGPRTQMRVSTGIQGRDKVDPMAELHPNVSPYRDSDESGEDEKVLPTCDFELPNFTPFILNQLGDEVALPTLEMETAPTHPEHDMEVCTPHHVDLHPVTGKSGSGRGLRSCQKKSAKAARIASRDLRNRRLDKLMEERRVLKSEILLRKMHRIAHGKKSRSRGKSHTKRKLRRIEKLTAHFRRTRLSAEPLSRSLLNVLAEWLLPLRNGLLPASRLRSSVLHLIKKFFLTTPAQVFRATCVEGVLNVLVGHPRETVSNKRILRYILNSWEDE